MAKSSVSLWVRDLPKPRPSPERMHAMREARWAPYRVARDQARKEATEAAEREVGPLSTANCS